MSLSQIPDEVEWNFDRNRVPESELVACCFWEYARESSFIRKLRQRSIDYWMPLYSKHAPQVEPKDDQLFEDIKKVGSIGYPAEVFLRGISCPPDGVLPDAPRLRPGEAYPLTGSFPKPWQQLSAGERAYRAHIRTDVETIPLRPFERGLSFDAKDIAQWVESRQRDRDAANQKVRRTFPKASEETLIGEGKLNFPDIKPSLCWESGCEATVVRIHWASFTDDEITNHFRKWVKANRPAHLPAPSGKGKKLSDWRVALKRLGIMRVLHTCTFADNRFPKVFKDWGEKSCYAARKGARKKFHDLFPFLIGEEDPLCWKTKGRRLK